MEIKAHNANYGGGAGSFLPPPSLKACLQGKPPQEKEWAAQSSVKK